MGDEPFGISPDFSCVDGLVGKLLDPSEKSENVEFLTILRGTDGCEESTCNLHISANVDG